MKLQIFRQLWGVEEPLEQSAARFKAKSYVGLEGSFENTQARVHAKRILEQYSLDFIAMTFSQPDPVSGQSVAAHLKSLQQGLHHALEMQPVLINIHGGYDAWNESDTMRFFEGALEQVSRLSIPVGFETHRGRPLNTPWRTKNVLDQFPELRLTLDLSHWVLVCERLPDDQNTALEAAAQACVHVHARVGSEQAPQVNDPQAPEHARLLTWFEQQWSQIWQAQKARGDTISTLTPEFGPPDYQPVLPFTRMPVSDLEVVSDWIAFRQTERFTSD